MIKVLIIEDDPMVAKFNAIYLDSIPGFSVVGVAENAEKGWELYQTTDVDLILLDVYMGKKTGLELLRDFRAADNPVDVIMISAANDKQSVQTALRNGAIDYLIKPFSFERFQEALVHYAQNHRLMTTRESMSQEEIDSMLLKSVPQHENILELPKGLTVRTFTTIVKQIMNRPHTEFSAADLAVDTGISRVSIRKYINYLVGQDLLSASVVYQETGRPLNRFMLKQDKVNILQAYMKE